MSNSPSLKTSNPSQPKMPPPSCRCMNMVSISAPPLDTEKQYTVGCAAARFTGPGTGYAPSQGFLQLPCLVSAKNAWITLRFDALEMFLYQDGFSTVPTHLCQRTAS
eukprot:Skav206998  [mRNA]  locus=scaffold1299:23199:24293:+ [translate_table: standard]